MATVYAELEEVKNTLSLSGESFADIDLNRAITAASRGIDRLCEDRFYADTVDATRTFTASDHMVVKMRPSLSSVTSVKIDEDLDYTYGTTLASSDYVKTPLNAAADSEPWRQLVIAPLGDHTFPTHLAGVQVVGLFGWSTTPSEIEQATIILAAKLVKRSREAPFGIAAFGLDGGEAVRIARNDPDVMFLAGPFMRSKVTVA